MKKNFKVLKTVVLVLIAVCFSNFTFAEDSSDPNATLAFKRMFVEPPTDNVAGTFKPVVELALKEFFGANPRFEHVQNKDNSDGVLLIKLEKLASTIEIETRLLVSSTSEVFAIEKTLVETTADDADLQRRIVSLLKAAMRRIPFSGTITGRENDQITLDVGSYQGLQIGDTVQIGRVDSVKKHPLLKQIVDVQMAPVGSARITHVEEGIAFGHVVEELPGEKIRRLQKITSVQHPVVHKSAVDEKRSRREGKFGIPASESELGAHPHFGYVSLALSAANFSASQSNGARTLTGSVFNPGFLVSGEAWFTSNIFADVYFGGSFMTYSQSGGSVAFNSGVSATTRTFGFDAGYRFLFDRSIYGPILGFKVGYHNWHWGVTTSPEDLASPRTYGGINVGVVGSLPVGRDGFGISTDIGFLLFPSYSESGTIFGESDASNTVFRLYVGGYYFFNTRLSVKAGLDFQSYATDFETTGASLSQKNIGFSPSVQYYF